jgi:hypothetical protein
VTTTGMAMCHTGAVSGKPTHSPEFQISTEVDRVVLSCRREATIVSRTCAADMPRSTASCYCWSTTPS